MKIGILTYCKIPNFGANLQAFSTYYSLKSLGHEPIILDWRPRTLCLGYEIDVSEEQRNAHLSFINNNLISTQHLSSEEELREVCLELDLDGILVGSDAVLQHTPLLSRIHLSRTKLFGLRKTSADRVYPNPFWGTFFDKGKRIPIATISASTQNTNFKLIMPWVKMAMRKSLASFCALSVRDNWTKQFLMNMGISSRKIFISPDPVFNLNNNIDNKLRAAARDVLNEKLSTVDCPYILLSFKRYGAPSSDWCSRFSQVAESHGIRCVGIGMPEENFRFKCHVTIDHPIDPLVWSEAIRGAWGYVGHNMHPVIVALHNSTPFFSIDYYGVLAANGTVNDKGSKIKDLLGYFDLDEYRYSPMASASPWPDPENVFERLLQFPRDRVSVLSKERAVEFQSHLQSIIEAISNANA